MNNQEKCDTLRHRYAQILCDVTGIVRAATASENPQIRKLAQYIENKEAPALHALSKFAHPHEMNPAFIDAVMGHYLGFQACILSDQFVCDPDPVMQKFVAEKLAKAEEYCAEFTDTDFNLASDSLTRPYYTALYGVECGGAARGAQLNCLGALLRDVQNVMRAGLSPTPAPQYPSGSTSRSSSWAGAPYEIR